MCLSGCKNSYKFVLDGGAVKNRDKLNEPTVGDRCRINFKTVSYQVIGSLFLFLNVRVGKDGRLFCSFWFAPGNERAANVPDNKYCIIAFSISQIRFL